MSRHSRITRRTVAALGLTLVGLAWLTAPGCSTDAVGIDACRVIESARCDAAPACEGDETSFGIASEEQVRNCKLFYNDHCLLGVENDAAEPAADDVDKCEAAIVAVAACKTKKVEAMSDCKDKKGNLVTMVDDAANTLTPCEAIKTPEKIKACKWIEAVEE